MNIPYNCDLFKNIEKSEINDFFSRINATTKTYKKDEIIFKGDEYINEIGIILSGKVIIGKETSTGNKTIIAVLTPDDFIGEVMAISHNKISNDVISGDHKTEILFIPVEAAVNNDKLSKNLLTILAKKAYFLNIRVYYLQLKTIRGKISKFLLEEANKTKSKTFSLNFNRQKMAEYLNVSRPSLSRELSKLKTEGIIDFYKETMKILDEEALESYQE